MLLVGQEGTLGTVQATGGVLSAFLLYTGGRLAARRHRLMVFSAVIILFLAGSLANTISFNAIGVLIFLARIRNRRAQICATRHCTVADAVHPGDFTDLSGSGRGGNPLHRREFCRTNFGGLNALEKEKQND